MRVGKGRESHIIHFSFFDVLFGTFGAFVFLMLVYVTGTMNLLDADFARQFNELVREREEFSQKVQALEAQASRAEDLERLYEEATETLHEVELERDALAGKIKTMETELAALSKLREEFQETGSAAQALRRENEALRQSLGEAEEKLAALQTRPLRLKTEGFPALTAGEKVHLAVAVEGGKPPYRWDYEGSLPPGLVFDRRDGILTGHVSRPGRHEITITVSDAAGARVSSEKLVLTVVENPVRPQSVSPWVVVLGLVGIVLLAYVPYQKYHVWRYVKKMREEGWEPVWVHKDASKRTPSVKVALEIVQGNGRAEAGELAAEVGSSLRVAPRGVEITAREKAVFLFGRGGTGQRVHVRLSGDPFMSQHHFRLEIDPPHVRIGQCADAKNPLKINGLVRAEGLLEDGDLIEAGYTVLKTTLRADV